MSFCAAWFRSARSLAIEVGQAVYGGVVLQRSLWIPAPNIKTWAIEVSDPKFPGSWRDLIEERARG